MLKDASSLAFFRVSNLPFSDCFLKLHRLTHLELSCTYVWPRNYLAVMAANPTLEVAILRSPGEWDLVPYGPLVIEPIIVFVPHLRQLGVYGEFVEQILGEFALPPGIHLSCDYIDGYILPHSDNLQIVSTVEKLHFMFSMDKGVISRVASESGPNGTFLLGDDHPELDLDIPRTRPLGSLEQLSISFADTGSGEGNPSLTFVDINGYLLETRSTGGIEGTRVLGGDQAMELRGRRSRLAERLKVQ